MNILKKVISIRPQEKLKKYVYWEKYILDFMLYQMMYVYTQKILGPPFLPQKLVQ